MIYERRRIDLNVVDVDREELSYKISKDNVHRSLKGGWRIAKSEGHLEVLKLSIRRHEGGSFLCSFGEDDLMES